MENEKVLLTEEGYKQLVEREELLKNKLIPDVVKRVGLAREQGDLSENAEYHAAKEEQGRLNGELEDIEFKLKHFEILKAEKTDAIQVGNTVECQDLSDNSIQQFTIVGTTEADFSKRRISNESPLGQALIGHKIGEVVTVKTPKGAGYQVKILQFK